VASALATDWDVTVIGDRPRHIAALREAGVRVVPLTEDENRTTVVLTGAEIDADDWIAQGRPGRLLAVRMAGKPAVSTAAAEAIGGATASLIGPDDADLVIDPILKVLGQGGITLPRPLIALGHHHHRFERFADRHIETLPATPEALLATVAKCLQHEEAHHHG
jgi:hypothetical protein